MLAQPNCCLQGSVLRTLEIHSNFQRASVLLRAVCAPEYELPVILVGRGRLERRPVCDRGRRLHGICHIQGIKETVSTVYLFRNFQAK